ncbi:2-dehydro-3-deoxygluconokinase [Microbacterium hydrothermale]|uniref:sugar kinase n=1 Tax=Microbacterium hydrothermale TaxID=857427 RepID=UPI0022262EF9|nr:sugar kinase [Microbacterium hydrothermale]MCW2163261.1 2-dehydro-3-deoxygluconokinase [Microbacterium hydrothermale]
MTRVVTLGETMALARTTEIGSLRHASGLALGIGGAESNVAVGLRRLGVDASWLGRVGDDPLGERIARELRGEGVDVHALVDAGAPTGLMIKERPSAASTAVHYYRRGSAGSRVRKADVPDGWVEEAALLHVTGITPLLSDTARATVLAVVERAHDAGVPVSFDINYRSALAAPEVAGPILREIAERATLVFGGVEELELLGPDAVTSLLAVGVAQVIVKRGPEGAAVLTPDGMTEALGFMIDPLDTVGAGDAFVAGYLSAWLEDLSAADALVRGNACGAVACLVPGDWEAAPTRRDLERFLAGGGDPVRR